MPIMIQLIVSSSRPRGRRLWVPVGNTTGEGRRFQDSNPQWLQRDFHPVFLEDRMMAEETMIELTEQQRQEIRDGGWPPRFVNSQTGETFVLIHQEMFDRIRAILEAEDGIADVEEMLPLTADVLDPRRKSA
jgi:hypothetical protein